MLDLEFLNGVFNQEGTSVEDKVKLIIAEHEAQTRGLIKKRDELLDNEHKLKEQIKSFSENEKTYSEKINTLEAELKKNSPEQHREYYEAQLNSKQKEFEKKLAELETEKDRYKTSHLKRLQDDAIAEGVKDIQFVDGLKQGFIATVLMNNNFEAKDIDGEIVFINKDNKKIQEVMHDYSLTNEGKAYIRNPSSGSGANTSVNKGGQSFGGKTMTRAEYETKVKTDPAGMSKFFQEGGKLID